MMRRNIAKPVLVFIALALVLIACGGNPQEAVCTSLGTLNTTLNRLAESTADATAADVKELKAQLDGPMAAIRTANNILNSQRLTDLLAEYDNLSQTIDNLPDDAPLGEAATQIQENVQRAQTALAQALSTLNCAP